MLDKYVEQILRAYNHIDTFIVTDDKGIIDYYITYRPDVNTNNPQKLIGKHVLDAWSRDLTEDTSTIMRTLKTGEPVVNEYQEFHYGELLMSSVNTTLPIKENGKLVGTATMVKYLWEPFARNEIVIDRVPGSYQTIYSIDHIKGVSEHIESLKSKIRMVAPSDSAVLIYGETGTGKELVAQSLHNLSGRRNNKFVSQNCAAIPENLLETILFGSVKGAYTGAENHAGLFEIAKGGTIFLDEMSSMEPGMQAKILKAIEDKQVTRIGDTKPIPTDVRIISAINEHPMDLLKNGKIRRDLFYRLSVVEIDLEPLRKRRDDLNYMVKYYITELNSKMNRAIIGLSDDVQEIFNIYDWPGNVRELKNVLEGAFNIATSRYIHKEYLPNYLLTRVETQVYPKEANYIAKWTNGDEFNLDLVVKNYEKEIIIKAIQNSSNLSDAAKKLGISKQNLNYKIQKYKIEKRE